MRDPVIYFRFSSFSFHPWFVPFSHSFLFRTKHRFTLAKMLQNCDTVLPTSFLDISTEERKRWKYTTWSNNRNWACDRWDRRVHFMCIAHLWIRKKIVSPNLYNFVRLKFAKFMKRKGFMAAMLFHPKIVPQLLNWIGSSFSQQNYKRSRTESNWIDHTQVNLFEMLFINHRLDRMCNQV